MRLQRHEDRLRSQELAAYLEGELSPAEAERIRVELAGSITARTRLQQLHSIRERLSAPDPELEDLDLVPALERAIASQAATSRARAWHPSWAWLPLLASAAAALMFVVREPDTEYRAKSAAPSDASLTRAGLRVYRADPVAPPEPIGAEISARDGLLFSYSNLGPAPFTHLLVFAVDGAAEVRWFYPAYVEPGTDPTSLAIEPDQKDFMLPNVVSHRYASGPLTIYALFLRQPLSVSAVEAWLASERFAPAEPPLKSAKLQTFELRVIP